ncbi:MAG: DUF1501 domain-containing protein [Thermoanaerobaculia bacterium]|nr:DUF1501 domain-containing protein [Thermoanaerobaculia bacterium]
MTTRRDFLRISACGAVGMTAISESLERLGLISNAAMAAPSDYRALVCIFLFGGNDANNMVIPVYGSGYTAYAAARGGSLAIAQGALAATTITPNSLGLAYALHPAMTGLKALFDSGKLAVVSNVGPLNQPTTKAQYQGNAAYRPYQLFSHSDQQSTWMAARADVKTKLGWGGLAADNQVSLNGASAYPPVTSLAGNNQFNLGQVTKPLGAAPAPTALNSILALNGYTTSAVDLARRSAFDTLRTFDTSVPLVNATSGVTQAALNIGTALKVDPVVGTFPNTNIGNQLKQVAKIIKLNQTAPELGLNRQIFFCSLGGFDTHQDQLAAHTNLYGRLSAAMSAFYAEMVVQGLQGRVTTFTESDFGRTLQPSGTGATVGSDHAWGSHQLVMGGAVVGTDFYGVNGPNGKVFPDHTLGAGNPLDTDGRGRFIPTCSVDQYAATLAQWFGVSLVDANTIFPLLYRFTTPNLGFMLPAF